MDDKSIKQSNVIYFNEYLTKEKQETKRFHASAVAGYTLMHILLGGNKIKSISTLDSDEEGITFYEDTVIHFNRDRQPSKESMSFLLNEAIIQAAGLISIDLVENEAVNLEENIDFLIRNMQSNIDNPRHPILRICDYFCYDITETLLFIHFTMRRAVNIIEHSDHFTDSLIELYNILLEGKRLDSDTIYAFTASRLGIHESEPV